MTNVFKKIHEAKDKTTNNELIQLYASYLNTNLIGPDTLLKNVPLLAIDFETTGLDPSKDDLLSIGAIPFQSNRIYFGQKKEWLVKPKSKLTAETIAIHGIKHCDVQDAPDLLEILPELLQMMHGRVVVAHFACIEEQFLDAALKNRTGEGIVFPCIDTMGIERQLSEEHKFDGLKKFFGIQKKASLRLSNLREKYNLPFYKPHDALTDALACAELLEAQTQTLELENYTLNQLLCLR